ncbi:MAG: ATP synthase F0 subunit B [Desulfobacterales bacterium]|jgi:F-type H+-transporting ATPase subunit b
MKISGINLRHYAVLALFEAALLVLFAGVAFGAGSSISVIPDVSLFVQIANFLIIIWVLNIILYKPIRNILIQRKEKITSLEQNIEKLNEDTAEKDEAYLAGIKDARARGLNEKEVLVKAGAEEEKRIIEQINQKAQANLAEVRENITKEAQNVRESLNKEIDTFANAISEKILGRAV